MDDNGVTPQGTYRTLLNVDPGKNTEKGVMEMTNLLSDPSGKMGGEVLPPIDQPGMKRIETADLLNITLHQV